MCHDFTIYAKLKFSFLLSHQDLVIIKGTFKKSSRHFTTLAIIFMLPGFPQQLIGKESACNAGDPAPVPALGRSLGEENGNPLQWAGEFHGQRSLVGCSPQGRRVGQDGSNLAHIKCLIKEGREKGCVLVCNFFFPLCD